MSLLAIENLVVRYGLLQAGRGVSFTIERGETLALVGANGAGKTTLLRTLTGLVAPRGGSIHFAGRPIDAVPPYERARLGLAMVPEGRRLFQGLTVRQNLELGSRAAPDQSRKAEDVDFVFGLFPELVRLQGRLSGLLSGGEQQMCAIGRALMARPKMLLIDEMSLGLAPVIVERIAGVIRTINRDRGVSILLVEQDVGLALEIATRGYVLDTGRIIIDGPSEQLLLRDDIRTAYLGLH
jgi:branched-chain amino acid transport system ATP-binding protein